MAKYYKSKYEANYFHVSDEDIDFKVLHLSENVNGVYDIKSTNEWVMNDYSLTEITAEEFYSKLSKAIYYFSNF